PELPAFKGVPGWEFTDLSKLDIDSYPPAPPGGRTVEPLFTGFGTDHGEAIVMPLADAMREHADLVDPHFGSVVSSDDPFVARNEAALGDGWFVYVPRGAKLEPVLLTAALSEKTALNWRVLVVLEEGASAEVWEQYLSAGA